MSDELDKAKALAAKVITTLLADIWNEETDVNWWTRPLAISLNRRT